MYSVKGESRTPRIKLGVISPAAHPRPGASAIAAFEYSCRMRAIFHAGAPQTASSAAYRHWKRLFRREISKARRQQRLRMAHSRDWSGLGEYVRTSALIVRQQLMLDLAGLLAGLRIGKGCRLFERAVSAILQATYGPGYAMVLRTITSTSGQG